MVRWAIAMTRGIADLTWPVQLLGRGIEGGEFVRKAAASTESFCLQHFEDTMSASGNVDFG